MAWLVWIIWTQEYEGARSVTLLILLHGVWVICRLNGVCVQYKFFIFPSHLSLGLPNICPALSFTTQNRVYIKTAKKSLVAATLKCLFPHLNRDNHHITILEQKLNVTEFAFLF